MAKNKTPFEQNQNPDRDTLMARLVENAAIEPQTANAKDTSGKGFEREPLHRGKPPKDAEPHKVQIVIQDLPVGEYR